jgi:hypothetical protein
MHATLKGLSLAVLVLMLVALLYSAYTALRYWSGIGV